MRRVSKNNEHISKYKKTLFLFAFIFTLLMTNSFSAYAAKWDGGTKWDGFDIKWMDDGHQLTLLGEGKVLVEYYEDDERKCGIYDLDLNPIMPLQSKYHISQEAKFSDGLIPASIEVMNEKGEHTADKCGYINEKGEEIIPFKYNVTGNFSDGLACVLNQEYKLGYIDKTGKEVIPCHFIYDGSEGFKRGYYGLFDFHEGLAVTERDGKFGYIDKTGKEVIECKFDYALEFAEGFAVVYEHHEEDSKAGYIDKTGNLVVPFIYEDGSKFVDGLACVSNKAEDFDNDGYPDYLHGYIDKTGKVVIPIDYVDANEFSDGLANVQRRPNENYMYIDKTGKVVLPAKYKDAMSFKEGLALVVDDDGTNGDVNIFLDGHYIDKTGKVLIPFVGEYEFEDGVMKVAEYWAETEKEGLIKNPLKHPEVVLNKGEDKPLDADEKEEKTEIMAKYSPQTVRVGMTHETEAPRYKDLDIYLIDDYNYFKLRDVAVLANGKNDQFSVAWNDEKKLISLEKGKAYELAKDGLEKGDKKEKKAVKSTANIEVDGKEVKLNAYNIDGNNYFKIRDLAKVLDFDVYWSGDYHEVVLDFVMPN